MNRFFAYLLVLSVVGGMASRFVAHDVCETAHSHEDVPHSHEHDCCPPPPPCESPCEPDHDHDQDQECPVEHHHHHAGCTHVMPLVADVQSRISLNSSAYFRLRLCLEDVCAPEAPVYEMDKPPLI